MSLLPNVAGHFGRVALSFQTALQLPDWNELYT